MKFLQDAKSKWIFTTDEGKRGGKTLHLKKIVDKAVAGIDCVEKVLMFTATGAEVGRGASASARAVPLQNAYLALQKCKFRVLVWASTHHRQEWTE